VFIDFIIHSCGRDLSDPRQRFKVDANSQQYNLTGGVLSSKEEEEEGGGGVLVVVEGGPKGVRRFTSLMMRRIDWNEKLTPQEIKEREEEKRKRREAYERGTNGQPIASSGGGEIEGKGDEMEEEEEEEEDDFDFEVGSTANNKCDLLWKVYNLNFMISVILFLLDGGGRVRCQRGLLVASSFRSATPQPRLGRCWRQKELLITGISPSEPMLLLKPKNSDLRLFYRT